MALYEHPNLTTRERQAKARQRAELAVKAQAIGWSPTKGLRGGFVYRSGGVIETHDFPLLLALCELREAGYVGVDEKTCAVWWVRR
jgi:hypothetical protein